ncbi:hypothetical protein CPB85DRAFT_204314 [Mucidula mucida]|nr:hypothetical protein CPB85DRAFT_204314 [Mucidula mucida]
MVLDENSKSFTVHMLSRLTRRVLKRRFWIRCLVQIFYRHLLWHCSKSRLFRLLSTSRV